MVDGVVFVSVQDGPKALATELTVHDVRCNVVLFIFSKENKLIFSVEGLRTLGNQYLRSAFDEDSDIVWILWSNGCDDRSLGNGVVWNVSLDSSFFLDHQLVQVHVAILKHSQQPTLGAVPNCLILRVFVDLHSRIAVVDDAVFDELHEFVVEVASQECVLQLVSDKP